MSNSRNYTFIVGLIVTIIGFISYASGIILGVFGIVASFGGGVIIAIGLSILALSPPFAAIILSVFITVAHFWDGISLDAFFGNIVFIAIGLVVLTLGLFLTIRAQKYKAWADHTA